MFSGPKKTVNIILPVEVYEKLKILAQDADWPLSRYIRQVLRRYLRHLEELEGDERDWWKIQ